MLHSVKPYYNTMQSSQKLSFQSKSKEEVTAKEISPKAKYTASMLHSHLSFNLDRFVFENIPHAEQKLLLSKKLEKVIPNILDGIAKVFEQSDSSCKDVAKTLKDEAKNARKIIEAEEAIKTKKARKEILKNVSY